MKKFITIIFMSLSFIAYAIERDIQEGESALYDVAPETLLAHAIMVGDLEKTKKLISEGTNLQQVSRDWFSYTKLFSDDATFSPYEAAVLTGNLDLIKYLSTFPSIYHNILPNVTDFGSGNQNYLSHLLGEMKNNPQYQDILVYLMKTAIKNKEEPALECGHYGDSCFWWIPKDKPYKDIFDLMIEWYGGDIRNLPRNNSFDNVSTEQLDYLVKNYQLDINAKSSSRFYGENLTLLMVALHNGEKEKIKYLLCNGADTAYVAPRYKPLPNHTDKTLYKNYSGYNAFDLANKANINLTEIIREKCNGY